LQCGGALIRRRLYGIFISAAAKPARTFMRLAPHHDHGPKAAERVVRLSAPLFPARATEVVAMFDILYLAIGIASFLVLTLYIYTCDRL
jgi:hypothetical protein